jgi:hypothetical protein
MNQARVRSLRKPDSTGSQRVGALADGNRAAGGEPVPVDHVDAEELGKGRPSDRFGRETDAVEYHGRMLHLIQTAIAPKSDRASVVRNKREISHHGVTVEQERCVDAAEQRAGASAVYRLSGQPRNGLETIWPGPPRSDQWLKTAVVSD